MSLGGHAGWPIHPTPAKKTPVIHMPCLSFHILSYPHHANGLYKCKPKPLIIVPLHAWIRLKWFPPLDEPYFLEWNKVVGSEKINDTQNDAVQQSCC